MSLLEEGQVIRGTYEVDRMLGEGAFAQVYRVNHRFLGRQAMKVFKMVGMTVEETVEILSEATLLSRMDHPNIIRVFDANTTETSGGVCGFFTMEYIAGGNLEQFWRSHGSRFVPVETAVDIVRQVCRGLCIAHSEKPPVIHRDVKPQNILIGFESEGLRVRLTDFGLARQVNPLTLLASSRGTRCFKGPEAFADPQSDSCAGDVWALGSTLYLLLTDRLPYASPGEADSPDPGRFARPLIPPGRLNIRVDPFLDQIVCRAVAVQAEDRYQDAIAMLEDLERWRPSSTPAADSKQLAAADMSKSALGEHSPPKVEEARKIAAAALELSKQFGRLAEAADMMEQALNTSPELRAEYEDKLRLWRRGIVM